MKKIIIVGVALALNGVGVMRAQEPVKVFLDAQNFTLSGTVTIEGRLVKGQPYSAEFVNESIQTLADGNRIVHRSTGRVSRDRDGRVRREDDRPSGGPTVSITDPVAGTTVTLDPATRTARETPAMQFFTVDQTLNGYGVQYGALRELVATRPLAVGRSGAETPAPAADAGGGARGGRGAGGGTRPRATADPVGEKLGDRVIEGVLASGVRRTTTIEKGAIGNEQPIKIVSEEWTSPELQVLVMTDLSDPRTGRSTYRLLKVTRVDPDPTLFQAPADYTVQRGRGRSATPAPTPAAGGAGGRGRVGRGGGDQ